MFTPLLSTLAVAAVARAQYSATYLPSDAPAQSEPGLQIGTNQCGTESSQTSLCQNAYINAVDDFCLWAPPWTDGTNSTIGDTEEEEVSWCMRSGYGTRLIPDGTIQGAHFVQTPDYVQITGFGDMTKLNIPAGDGGGELDPHSWTGLGNPQGGLVFGTTFGGMQQYHEWTNFMSADEFCFRACVDGPMSPTWCMHTYDTMGCEWNMPANYDIGTFSECSADSGTPMGVYGTSTWDPNLQHSTDVTTPPAGTVPASSSCTMYSSISNGVAVSPTATATMSSSASTSSSASSSTGTASSSSSSSGSTATSTASKSSASGMTTSSKAAPGSNTVPTASHGSSFSTAAAASPTATGAALTLPIPIAGPVAALLAVLGGMMAL